MALLSHDRALERALDTAFRASGRLCQAHVEGSGGVVIEFINHVRGVWRHDGTHYVYTPAGYVDAVHSATDVAGAVHYSLDVICKA